MTFDSPVLHRLLGGRFALVAELRLVNHPLLRVYFITSVCRAAAKLLDNRWVL